uniref:DUF659 domain-containing protein n=1 Tax=Cajanus cajan TaxID=3821 RepID=A0A151REH0_CAJCA|nr:hypothetical protein KK1_037787 [Cajanus cajan]
MPRTTLGAQHTLKIYYPNGTIFLKFVDTFHAFKIANMLYELFKKVDLYISLENIVHMVMGNVANYVIASRFLEIEFPKLFWSPCVAHCINLMLQGMGKVSQVVSHASKITKYFYNHCYALYLMRKHTSGREILHLVPTHFVTNFIYLQSNKMIIDNHWKKKRNRLLEHQKLNDLVFVHYNLRKKRHQSYDPINLETLDDHSNWVMEESPPFLTNEEMDVLCNDLANMTIQPISSDIYIFFTLLFHCFIFVIPKLEFAITNI